MDFYPIDEITAVLRLLMATFLGALVGFEREIDDRRAGLRTYAAVCLGSCAFSLVSLNLDLSEPHTARIPAQVVSGIGFLGAGVILRQNLQITGLTSAATIWASASVGLATGYGLHIIGDTTAFILVVLLALHRIPV